MLSPEEIHEYVRIGNHTKLVEMVIERSLLYMVNNDDHIEEYVESLPEYKAIVLHFGKSLCVVCTSHYSHLWLTTCGHSEHKLCNGCLEEIERRNGSCPFRCSQQPIHTHTFVDVRMNEDESLVWALV
jgi:hypothetical protein